MPAPDKQLRLSAIEFLQDGIAVKLAKDRQSASGEVLVSQPHRFIVSSAEKALGEILLVEAALAQEGYAPLSEAEHDRIVRAAPPPSPPTPSAPLPG